MSSSQKALRPPISARWKIKGSSCLRPFLILGIIACTISLRAADDEVKTPEDLKREAAIAQFTQKMQDANYPALFAKAAAEFKVPVEILEGVSFAETRWEHLQWPEGEKVSPENGMPRPYGIMSLWDNDHFGHTLQQAAALIGKSPEDLKNDPLDNMRGAAALMRQIYDKNPKPGFAQNTDLESWFNAISKYSGIPQPELNSQHAFEVYRHLDQGFNEYGIKLEKVPNLKLDAMAAEVARIKDLAMRQKMVTMTPEDLAGMGTPDAPTNVTKIHREHDLAAPAIAPAIAPTTTTPASASLVPSSNYGLIAALLISSVIVFFLIRLRTKPVR